MNLANKSRVSPSASYLAHGIPLFNDITRKQGLNANESFTFNSSRNLNMEQSNDNFMNDYTIPQFYDMVQP